MEIPPARIVTVETLSLPDCLDDTVEPLRLDNSTRGRGNAITLGRLASEDRRISMRDRDHEWETPNGARAELTEIIELQSPVLALCHDSTSTTPAMQEERQRDLEEELSQLLEWFRDTFTHIGKHGRVSLKDFKCAARDCEVSVIINVHVMQNM